MEQNPNLFHLTSHNMPVDLFENTLQQLRSAFQIMKLDDNYAKILESPARILKFHLPIRMDNGKINIFEAYRIQHNNACGPYKGGVRLAPQVDESEVRALATWMSLKCSIAQIPLGGAKGGIKVDASKLSQGEKEKLLRSYTRAIAPFIGPDIDAPGPDMNTNPQTMAWMADELIKFHHGDHRWKAAITGKPLEFGGSLGRLDATSRGGMYIIEEVIRTFSLNKEPNFVIQGFGNVGMYLAKILFENDHKVIGISDVHGGIYCKNGLDINALIRHYEKEKTLKNFKNTESLSNEQLLELPCDILIPAAIENVITKKNADKIKAKIIIELANGPTTPEADKILETKKIILIPDILSNAGGVTVSYFEMVQNLSNFFWSEFEIKSKLKPIMKKAWNSTILTANKYKCNYRMAAFISSIQRIVDAIKFKGENY